jgi:aldehyde:ferredoxin oxidoreductase
VGGTPGARLARLGIDALVIEGRAASEEWFWLEIASTGMHLRQAHGLTGRTIYETVSRLQGGRDRRASTLAIGPAGELRLSAANIGVTDLDGIPSRHAGRGGLGAVMGAKRLKAIVVDDAGAPCVPLADEDLFHNAARRFAQKLREHPSTGKSLPVYGTSVLINVINELGGLPTRNFSEGAFEHAGAISGEALRDLVVAREGRTTHPCMPGCVIRCSNILPDADGREVTRALEYESISLLGANCGIGDLDVIARMNRLCDEYGLDTMETGDALAVAMEAGVLDFGDGERAVDVIKQMGEGTPLGRVLGHGATVTGRVFSVSRVPAVKGQGMAAYDPRVLKGTGVTYATSPMGADHTAGNALPGTVLPGVGAPDTTRREHQIALSRYLQELAALFDTVGLCWFTRGPILTDNSLLLDMLQGRLGDEFSMDALRMTGQQTLQRELSFNRAAGFGPQDDRLPDFFLTEQLSPTGLTFDISDRELDNALAALT